MGQNAKLGKYTEEQMSAIKLVIAFGREDHSLECYEKIAKETKDISISSGISISFLQGLFLMMIFGAAIYAWSFGGLLVQLEFINPTTGKEYVVGDIIVVYYSILYGVMQLFSLMPAIPSLARISIVGKEIFDVIERDPQIGSHAEAENTVESIEIGEGITFKDVKFKYPTAPEEAKPVMECGNFTIRSGTSTAIVGPSGSGKSTIVQLLNRFYDPDEGQISYGDDNVKKLPIDKLREMIGWVGQEPVLIIGTIRENLRYGNADATEEQMKEALRKASALGFVEELEDGLDTYVGTASILNLSGG